MKYKASKNGIVHTFIEKQEFDNFVANNADWVQSFQREPNDDFVFGKELMTQFILQKKADNLSPEDTFEGDINVPLAFWPTIEAV